MKKIKSFLFGIILIIVNISIYIAALFLPEIFGVPFYKLFGVSLTYNQASFGGVITILLISIIVYITYHFARKRKRTK